MMNVRLRAGTTVPDREDVGGTTSLGRFSTPDPNLTTTRSGFEVRIVNELLIGNVEEIM